MKRRKNPVPLSSKAAEIEQAKKLYTLFTGHEPATVVATIRKPEMPDVVVEIGTIDFIGYTTVRDGQIESYIHKFHSTARPLFCVKPDGKQLYMIGGSYNFTERGIVDATKKRR